MAMQRNRVRESVLHVHHHFEDSVLGDVHAKLDAILRSLQTVKMGEAIIMGSLDDLTAAVTENTSVDQSAIVLLNDIAARLEAAQNDPAAVAQLATDIRSSSTELAAAVAANTPAASE